jgi:hypothetical protein
MPRMSDSPQLHLTGERRRRDYTFASSGAERVPSIAIVRGATQDIGLVGRTRALTDIVATISCWIVVPSACKFVSGRRFISCLPMVFCTARTAMIAVIRRDLNAMAK